MESDDIIQIIRNQLLIGWDHSICNLIVWFNLVSQKSWTNESFVNGLGCPCSLLVWRPNGRAEYTHKEPTELVGPLGPILPQTQATNGTTNCYSPHNSNPVFTSCLRGVGAHHTDTGFYTNRLINIVLGTDACKYLAR